MDPLALIRPPFRPCLHHFLTPRRHSYSSVLARSLSSSSSSSSSSSGDPDVQKKLVEIIRLETGKIRVSDFVEERSRFLQGIADEAMQESDRITSDALRCLDEASAKTIKDVDENIQVLEEQLASSRVDIEAREHELDEFEKRLEVARSEGLFFKALYKPSKRWKDRSPEEQKAILNEVKNIAWITKSSLESRSRKGLYIFLIFVLTIFLLEGFTLPDFSWSRVTVICIVLVFLSMQFIFEMIISSNKDMRK